LAWIWIQHQEKNSFELILKPVEEMPLEKLFYNSKKKNS
jgi:hypothetical protein